jgi:hypothetical protein
LKILHKNGNLQLIAENQTSIVLLPFFDHPAHFLLAQAQSRKLPALPRQAVVKLGEWGVIVHDQAKGEVREKRATVDIWVDCSLTRVSNLSPENDCMQFRTDIKVQATTITDQGKRETQTAETAWVIEFHRDLSDPEVNWTDEELTCLLQGAERYRFTTLATCSPPGNKPLGAVARFVFGNSPDGYRRLFTYAARLYHLQTPKTYSFDLGDEKLYGSYSRLTGSLKLYRLAFSQNALFLASSYVHEYTHFLQANRDQGSHLGGIYSALNQNQREIEAHCIQIEWLQKHPALPGELQCRKEDMCKNLRDIFNEIYESKLECCNGKLPRNWIRAEILALEKGGSREALDSRERPFVKKTFSPSAPPDNRWQDVVK